MMNFNWGSLQVNNGEPAELVLIVAPNIRQAQDWCHVHDVNPRSRNVKIITHVEQLHGYRDVYCVYLGTGNLQISKYLDRLKAIGQVKILPETEETEHVHDMFLFGDPPPE